MTEFLEQAKTYEHLIKGDKVLVNPVELQKVEQRNMSVFMVDKICCSRNDTAIKSLTCLGIKPQRIFKGKGYFMWDTVVRT